MLGLILIVFVRRRYEANVFKMKFSFDKNMLNAVIFLTAEFLLTVYQSKFVRH